jgi:hypothetical protein
MLRQLMPIGTYCRTGKTPTGTKGQREKVEGNTMKGTKTLTRTPGGSKGRREKKRRP